ncbi:MAG: hypothetical protein SOY47_03190 [Lachnospiraceae bacterium]|nr:hypothetical protein [Lachnospiraceae bacterium]
MSYIDAEAGQEAVYLLADFQESDGAEEPDEHVSGGSFLPHSIHLRLRNSEHGHGLGEE